MDSRDPAVEAIVVHHGDPAVTRAAIDALAATDGARLGLTLVDNGPRDAHTGALHVHVASRRDRFALGTRSTTPAHNLGYAGGLAAGMRLGREHAAEFWWLLNHDVEVEPDTLSRLLEVILSRSDAGACGPALLDADRPDVIWNAGSDIEWPGARPRSRLHDAPRSELPGEPFEVGYLAGCAVLIAAATLERVGGLAEDYFLYFEDADLGERIRDAGLVSLVVPGALARHRAGCAVHAIGDSAAYFRVRNRIIFSRRWGRGPRAFAARLAFAARRLARGGAEARGAWHGLRGRAGTGTGTGIGTGTGTGTG